MFSVLTKVYGTLRRRKVIIVLIIYFRRLFSLSIESIFIFWTAMSTWNQCLWFQSKSASGMSTWNTFSVALTTNANTTKLCYWKVLFRRDIPILLVSALWSTKDDELPLLPELVNEQRRVTKLAMLWCRLNSPSVRIPHISISVGHPDKTPLSKGWSILGHFLYIVNSKMWQ